MYRHYPMPPFPIQLRLTGFTMFIPRQSIAQCVIYKVIGINAIGCATSAVLGLVGSFRGRSAAQNEQK